MNRTGLIIALGLAAIVGLAFGIFPQLDLMVSAPLHDIVRNGNVFGLRIYAPLKQAKVQRIDGSFHFIMIDQPAAFQAAVEAFLK